MRWCAKYKKRIVQFSTCEVYGITAAQCVGKGPMELPCPFAEDTTPLIMGPVNEQRWIYACAKQLLERVLHAYGLQEGLNWTVIRPFNFVGERIDYLPSEKAGCPRLFSHLIDSLLYGHPIRLVDGGKALRGYTHISEAVECIMRILDNATARSSTLARPRTRPPSRRLPTASATCSRSSAPPRTRPARTLSRSRARSFTARATPTGAFVVERERNGA